MIFDDDPAPVFFGKGQRAPRPVLIADADHGAGSFLRSVVQGNLGAVQRKEPSGISPGRRRLAAQRQGKRPRPGGEGQSGPVFGRLAFLPAA